MKWRYIVFIVSKREMKYEIHVQQKHLETNQVYNSLFPIQRIFIVTGVASLNFPLFTKRPLD